MRVNCSVGQAIESRSIETTNESCETKRAWASEKEEGETKSRAEAGRFEYVDILSGICRSRNNITSACFVLFVSEPMSAITPAGLHSIATLIKRYANHHPKHLNLLCDPRSFDPGLKRPHAVSRTLRTHLTSKVVNTADDLQHTRTPRLRLNLLSPPQQVQQNQHRQPRLRLRLSLLLLTMQSS